MTTARSGAGAASDPGPEGPCDAAARSADISVEPPAPLLAVPLQRLLDDRQGARRRLDLVDLDRLALEELVVLEEPAKHHEPVGGQLRGLAEAVELGVIDRHGQDL